MTRLAGQHDRERVLAATDLVQLVGEHVSLKRKGREFVGICPFHDDHDPSLHVVPHKNIYKCFVCGAGHNAIDFVMNFHRMEFPDALRLLAQRAGIALAERRENRPKGEPDRAALLEANELAASFFRRCLEHDAHGRTARAMLLDRGLGEGVTRAFGVGFAPDRWDGLLTAATKRGANLRALHAVGLLRRGGDGRREFDYFRNRLVFPIHNQLGQPIAFGGRRMNPEDEPKYINSPESAVFEKSRTLYGLHLARKAIGDSGVAVVCEGYTDVIAMHQAGLNHAVAALGTALTASHAKILNRLCDRVVLLFDGDDAGRKAADRAIEILFEEPIDLRICVLPRGLDPDELLREEDGVETLRSSLEDAPDVLRYVIGRLRAELDSLDSSVARQKRVGEFLQHLTDLGFSRLPGLRRRMILPEIAKLLGVSLRDVEAALPRERPRPARGATSEAPGEPVPIDEGAAAVVPRGRLEAERAFLGVLLHAPTVRRTPVDAGDGHLLPVSEVLPPEAMLHPTHRALYEILHDLIEADEPYTPHDVAARTVEAVVRDAAFDLAMRGERLCGDGDEAAAEQLRIVAQALLKHDDRSESRRSFARLRERVSETNGRSNHDALLEAVNHRRRSGDDFAAIARGVRR